MDEKMETAALKQELATAKHELAEARAYIRRRILAEADHARKAVAGRVSKTDELARRAAACTHWRWVPGMLVDGIRIDGTCHFVAGLGKPWRKEDFREMICDECLPDLSDPATLGCLLALVREAWTRVPEYNHWVNYAVPVFDGLETWRVGCIIDRAKMFAVCNLATMKIVEAASEAEALVAALEAAP